MLENVAGMRYPHPITANVATSCNDGTVPLMWYTAKDGGCLERDMGMVKRLGQGNPTFAGW
jgi:hypothetical protein